MPELIPVEQARIIVDNRELKSKVLEELYRQKVQLDIRQLPVADYIVSERVGIEFKKIADFEASIIDGRLFTQCEELIDNFERPVLIIEGDCLFHGRVHPNAVRGAIASVTTDYGIPVINVDSPEEAAQLIIAYARREQSEIEPIIKYNFIRKGMSDTQLQEAIISGFPTVGTKLARELLKKFKSIKGVMNAKIEELLEIPKIGNIKAARIYELINKEYEYGKKQKKENVVSNK